MISDLISVVQGFMDSTGGAVAVIFIVAVIFMGIKSKPSNGGSSNTTNNNQQ